MRKPEVAGIESCRHFPKTGAKRVIHILALFTSRKENMNEEEIIALIMKGSIYHADEGTSGYLLSYETAKKIYDLLKNAGALQIHDKKKG